MTWSIHPAEWKKLSKDEKSFLIFSGEVEAGQDWKVTRVAQLTGLEPRDLEHHVEVERGWESHDKGYLHQIVVSAGILRGLDIEKLTSRGKQAL